MAIKKARDAAKKGGVPTKDGNPSSVSQLFPTCFVDGLSINKKNMSFGTSVLLGRESVGQCSKGGSKMAKNASKL